MPFVARALLPGPVFSGSFLAAPNARSPRIWFYSTPDTRATVLGANYFNDATRLLNQGDIIFAVVNTGGTMQVTLLAVTSQSQASQVVVTQLSLN